MLAAQYRRDFGQFHLADAAQLLLHLLLLVVQLPLVGQALPFAAAADAEVRAEGLGALIAFLVKSHHFGFGVFVFLASHLQIYYVAGHGIGDKYSQAVHVGDGFAFSGHVLDGDIFQKG